MSEKPYINRYRIAQAGNPRAKPASEILLRGEMIGVSFDPQYSYAFDSRLTQNQFSSLQADDFYNPKQNFAIVDNAHGQKLFISGRSLFKSKADYEAYFKEPRNVRKSRVLYDLLHHPAFDDGAMQSLRDELPDYLSVARTIKNICEQITLNPYDERTLQAEQHVAKIAAEYVPHDILLDILNRDEHAIIVRAKPPAMIDMKDRVNGHVNGYHAKDAHFVLADSFFGQKTLGERIKIATAHIHSEQAVRR